MSGQVLRIGTRKSAMALAQTDEVARLLLDDGKLRLRVDAFGPDFADTTVLVGGVLSDRKGVNVPGVVLPISPLTAKDLADLDFGLKLGALVLENLIRFRLGHASAGVSAFLSVLKPSGVVAVAARHAIAQGNKAFNSFYR